MDSFIRVISSADSWIQDYAGEEKVITAADIAKLVPITSFKEMCCPPSDLIKLIQVDRFYTATTCLTASPTTAASHYTGRVYCTR